MKSLAFNLTSMLVAYYAFAAIGFCQPVTRSIYVLEDEKHHQWCGYRTETAWSSDIDAVSAVVSAVVDYTNDQMTSIRVATVDWPGAGDWAVYDTYTLDSNGKLQGLKRVINVLPGDRSEHEE